RSGVLSCVTRLLATSSTVTGTALPSSVNTRVMPTLRPTSHSDIANSLFVSCPRSTEGADSNWPAIRCSAPRSARFYVASYVASTARKAPGRPKLFVRLPAFPAKSRFFPFDELLQLDLHVDTGGQVELHQLVDCLVGRVDDVHQPQVRADLELIARGLVDVRRAQHIEALDARRQRHGPLHHGAGALGGLDDLERRLVDQLVVERLQPNPDLLVLHGRYSITFDTTPAPTVRPPSRIAKRSPSSIAIGWISVTVIATLSPGITISVPAGSSQLPVTSVVRK